jgi:hypothetical protein
MLKLPGVRSVDRQGRLFEVEIHNAGLSRHYVGEFCEDATAVLSGGVRLKTDSRIKTCPDIHLSKRVFCEVKGVGCSKRAIVYDHRLAKDRQFVDESRATLLYWFWRHRFRVLNAKTENELYAGLAASLESVVVVDFPTLERYLLARPVKVMNTGSFTKDGKRLGYGGYGYGRGWSVKVSEFEEGSRVVRSLFPIEVRGQRLTGFGVYISPGAERALRGVFPR